MSADMRVVLTSFQGSRAILGLHYGARHARLELERQSSPPCGAQPRTGQNPSPTYAGAPASKRQLRRRL